MHILHVSDIHCNLDALEAVIEKYGRDTDLIAITGDICCNGRLVRTLKRAALKVKAVTGNMDDLHIARILRDNNWLLDGRIEVYSDNGTAIAGIGGLQPLQDLKRVAADLSRVTYNRLLILSHYPAHGFLDITYSGVHAGLYELREFIEEFKPIIFMHGHIHEARGIARYGATLIVNPGPLAEGYYAIVEVGADEAEAKLYRM